MASFMERLAIIITADGKGAIREIEKVGTTAEREMGRAKTSADKWGATFVRTGALMVGASAVMGAGLFKAAQAFDEAHQAELRLQNSLANNPRLAGESASGYLKLANAIQQKTAADGDDVVAGMASLAQFRVTGSEIKQLTPLVVDLARKTGMDLVTANKLVGKALDGNAGALKRQGISVDENVYKTDRYKAVMDALRGTVGGFAEREGQTFSGQLARLKNNLRDVEEAIGGGVVKVLNDLFPVINKATEGFKGLDSATGGTIGQITAIGTLGVGAAGALLLILGAAVKLKTTMEGISTTFPRMSAAFSSIGPAVGIVGGLTFGFYELFRVLGFYGQITSGVTVNVDALTNHQDKLRTQLRDLQTELNGLSDHMKRAATDPSGAAAATQTYNAKVKDLIESTRKLAQESPTLARELIDQARAAGMNEEAIRKLVTVVSDVERARNHAADASSRDAQATRDHTDATDSNTRALWNSYNAKLAAINASLGLEGAVLNEQSAVENLNRVNADQSASELDKKQALLQAKESLVALGAAAVEAATKQKGGALTAEEAKNIQVKALSETAEQLAPGSPLRTWLEQYIWTLGQIPTNKFTSISAYLQPAIDGVNGLIDWINRQHATVTVGEIVSASGGYYPTTTDLNPPPGGAEGAIVRQPTLALIGEAGPEALVPLHKMPGAAPVPDMSSMAASAQMYGGVAKIVVPVVLDGRVVTEVVVSNLNRAGGPKISQKAVA